MKKYLISDEKLTDIGNAIREKTGKTDLIPVDQMDEEISSIQVGVDTSDATAAPGELLVGKTAYVNEQKITGTMANNGAVSQSLNAGGSYTIPAGYHNGEGKVNANSLVSQTSGTAEAGEILKGETAWVNGSQVTGTMENRGAVSQALNAGESYTVPVDYHDGNGKITANSLASQTDGDAVAGDILTGKIAWVDGAKVTGTMANNGAVSQAINAGGSYTIPAGYHNGSGKVTGNSLASQTSANAAAGDIRSGKTAWVNGANVTGTLVPASMISGSVAVSDGKVTIPNLSNYANFIICGSRAGMTLQRGYGFALYGGRINGTLFSAYTNGADYGSDARVIMSSSKPTVSGNTVTLSGSMSQASPYYYVAWN